jgi:hypothetical protein
MEVQCACSFPNMMRTFQCVPLAQPRTVIIRQDDCDSSGFYKWIPSIEMVNTGCVVVQKSNEIAKN